MPGVVRYVFVGGSMDGAVRLVPADEPYRAYLHEGQDHWSELYVATGARLEHPDHGDLPVLQFTERREEERRDEDLLQY